MSNTQSIIVYQNPAQQAFWEGGYLIPVLGSMFAGLVLFVVLMGLAEKLLGNRRVNTLVMVGAATASAAAGMLVFQQLFI